MAGPGGIPKDPAKRVRRNKETRSTLPDAPATAFRSMPGGVWLPPTVRWWSAWCASAQSSKFTEPTWQRLEMLVPLVDRYWSTGSVDALKEIRLNESLLGAMPADLQRLKWDLAESAAPAAPRSDELASWRRKRRVVDDAAGATT